MGHSIFTPPNLLSLLRLALIPFIVFFMHHVPASAPWIAVLLFVLAGISDLLDGILARRTKAWTVMGSYLDPLADKLVSLSVLISLVTVRVIPSWFVVIVMLILSKEIAVSAILGIAASHHQQVARSKAEAGEGIFQFAALVSLLLYETLKWQTGWVIGISLLSIATAYHIKAALDYSLAFVKLSRVQT